MTRTKVYLAIDAHARHCVLGTMDAHGQFQRSWRFETSEKELITHVESVQGGTKILTVEEGPLAYWISRTLTPFVHEILIADPRETPLISRNARKGDKVDVRCLCRLLRMGELKAVYHPADDKRAIFKAAVQQYLDLRNHQVRLKHKIKAKYRTWGVHNVDGMSVYGPRKRGLYLTQIRSSAIRHQLERLYTVLDLTIAEQSVALCEAKRLGRSFPELTEFIKMPGVGPIGALIFDAYVQTPHRFRKKSQLYSYCQLSIMDRSSDGKPLAHKRLDRVGNSELKAMSYRAFLTALYAKSDNEVKRYYLRALSKINNHTRARLSTQRKIISVMHGVWRRKEEYRPELF
jgi:transposase